jgi:hypothetical protein
MDDCLHVAILDSSIIMAGLGQLLRQHARLCIHRIACSRGAPTPLSAIAPARILIFDLTAVSADQLRSILHGEGAVTLIGIDIPRGLALTFAGKASSLGGAEDLVRLLDNLDETICRCGPQVGSTLLHPIQFEDQGETS